MDYPWHEEPTPVKQVLSFRVHFGFQGYPLHERLCGSIEAANSLAAVWRNASKRTVGFIEAVMVPSFRWIP